MHDERVGRNSDIRWLRVSDLRVSEKAQRKLQPARVRKIMAEFDRDDLGIMTASLRDGVWWLVDGQHRRAALIEIGCGDMRVECNCYTNLTSAQEAELFLKLNDTLTVRQFDKFSVGIEADRKQEVAITGIVEGLGLRIGTRNGDIGATSALKGVFTRYGADCLAATLRILRDAYGDTAFESSAIKGMGMVVHRYGERLDAGKCVQKLSADRRGFNGLLASAYFLKGRNGKDLPFNVGNAIVEAYNSGRGGVKLPSWFD